MPSEESQHPSAAPSIGDEESNVPPPLSVKKEPPPLPSSYRPRKAATASAQPRHVSSSEGLDASLPPPPAPSLKPEGATDLHAYQEESHQDERDALLAAIRKGK